MKIESIFFLLFLAEVLSEKVVPTEPIGETRDEEERLHMHEEEIKHLREERQPHPQRRKLAKGEKKLKHEQTGKCLDFAHSGFYAYGHLVDCGSTNTKVKERNSIHGGGLKTYDIVDGPQEGKCLDSWSEGSYPCDGTSWQDWQKSDVGSKKVYVTRPILLRIPGRLGEQRTRHGQLQPRLHLSALEIGVADNHDSHFYVTCEFEW